MRITMPPTSSLRRILQPDSWTVLAIAAINGQAAARSGNAIERAASMTAPSFSSSKS
jgi:hypothetical protein